MTSTAPAALAIDDADDPRIGAYRDIRERDLVGRQGRFVAEGKVVLDVLFSAGRFEAESALVLDSRLAGMSATLAKAPPGMPVYVASRAVMDHRRISHPSRHPGDRQQARVGDGGRSPGRVRPKGACAGVGRHLEP